MDIHIRHMESRDLPDLFEIYSFPAVTENSSQLPYLSSDTVANLFSNKAHYVLVAEVSSKVVGHVTLFLSQKVRDRHSAPLAIAIHPDFQGKGVGKALMLEALNQADNWMNLIRIELDVQVDNAPAIALYKSVGFEVEGTRRMSTFKNGAYTDLLLMSRIRPDVLEAASK